MERYLVSYRIAPEGMWEPRAHALRMAVSQINTGGVEWCDTDSFHLLRSSYALDHIVRHLARAIDSDRDLVLVVCVDSAEARFAGRLKDDSLYDLLPRLARAETGVEEPHDPAR